MANPWDSDPIVNAGPVYGAPAPPGAQYQGPQAQANLTHTQQEIDLAAQTAASTAAKAKAESQSAQIAAQSAQEAYNSAHPKGTGATVLGPDSLKSLSAPDQELVKALADGRLAFPGGFALKAPWWQQKLEQVAAFDPSFDATNYNNRAKARAMLLTGKVGASANALNTAIGHLGMLSDQAGGTASHGFIPLNAVENYAAKTFGDSGVTNFQDTAQKLADELESVYRNGGGAEQGVVRQLQSLNPNLSAKQKTGIIQNALDLLSSKQAANLYQYNIGSGGKPEVDLLDPAARAVLDKFPSIRDKYFAPSPSAFSSQAAALLRANGGSPPSGGGGASSPPPPPMPNDPLAPAGGSTKETIDPNLTPVRREYMARLQAGQTGAQLVGFLRQAGVNDPKLLKAASDQAAFRRKNPNVPIQQFDTSAIDHITQQMGLVNRAVNAVGQTDAGAGAIAAGNAALGNYGPDLVGALGGNEMQARLATQQSAQDHPASALTGSIVGGTAAAMAGEAALARGAGMAPGFARSLLADSGYGAVAGSGASPDNRGGGAALGALAGAAGSVGGQALARGGGAALSGVKNANVNALLGSDIPLTVGQAVGGGMKSIEDKLTSFVPGIAARRQEGYRVFNRKAFDKALEPIGQTVGNQTGEEAVASARGAVSQAFQSALRGKSAVPDAQFIGQAKTALGRLAAIKRNDLGQEIVGQIEESTKDLFDPKTGAISGENMQTFLEGLRQIKQAYRNDPLSNGVISPAIKQIEKSVEGMFERQAPEVMPAYKAAKGAYRRVSILADAVDKGKNTDGIFTPAQLGTADRANAKRLTGAMNAASGGTPFHDLQRAAQNVLPGKVPDSGTAGRAALLAVPGAIAASGGGLGYAAGDGRTGAETGLGLAGMLALLYTKRGQSFLVNAAVKRGAKTKAAGAALRQVAPYFGAAGASVPGAMSDQ